MAGMGVACRFSGRGHLAITGFAATVPNLARQIQSLNHDYHTASLAPKVKEQVVFRATSPAAKDANGSLEATAKAAVF
jgi:hypothetical protein